MTAPEVAALTSTLANIHTLALTLAADYQNLVTQLSLETFTAVKAEYLAAAALITPFALPLIAYSKAVKATGAGGATPGLTGLAGLLSGLGATIGSLLASLGL